MIYCLYNVATNALLGIGSNPFNLLEGQQQVSEDEQTVYLSGRITE